MATQSAINWPEQFLPGTTDNFVSNERIAKDLTSTQIWALLANISRWKSYYKNCEIYHAWVVEDLEGQRVRILTQESQIGQVFKEWEVKKPNKMLLGHQDWLDGLITAASGKQVEDTNLEAVNFPVRQLDA